MIDLVVNSSGGVTVAHDRAEMGRVVALEVGRRSRKARLILEDGRDVRLLDLSEAMVAALREGLAAQVVRVDGWSVAESRDIHLAIVD